MSARSITRILLSLPAASWSIWVPSNIVIEATAVTQRCG
jgi:hypothetical protein